EANTRRPNEESTTDANGSVDLNAPLGGPIDQRLNTQPTDAESLETGAAISSRSIGLKAGKNTTLDQLREQQLKFNEQRKSQVQLPGSEAAEKIRANNEAIRKAAEDAESEDGNFDKGTPKLPPTRTPEDVKPQDDAPVISNPDRNATEAPDQAAPEVEVKAREKINFVEVDSFSKGVADAPLSAIVQNAESLMQRQRFASAIVEFDKAEGISPDDPMVQMGRSVAELGGGYYRRAEIYLRRSIEKDPAVLLGRYNLRGMLTDVRLDVILKDLKKVAAENPQDAGPLMLLGYVYFNSGAEVRGYEYIQRARQIAGEDPALDAMLEAWKIEQQ
ncbi:MAG TPA: hypothetical protein PK402_12855, partial [Tepidisphaeraceae bacterium]|nr:hypothetical protein [Tepidisphaeraceae bacterium]